MRFSVAACVLLFALPASAFEGTMDVTIQNGKQNVAATYYLANSGDFRIDMEVPTKKRRRAVKTSIYMPAGSDKMYIAMHKDKMVMENSRSQAKQLTSLQKRERKANLKVEKLGTKMINGHKTRHVRVTDKKEGTTTEMWLSDLISAKQFSNAFRSQQSDNDVGDEMLKVFKRHNIKPGFPMKMIMREDGETTIMNVKKVTKKKLGKAVFTPPKNYKHAPSMSDIMPPGGIKNMPANKDEAERMRDQMRKQMEALKQRYQR